MQKCQLKTMVIAIFGAIMISSCGPLVQMFDADVKIPPKYPLELTNKSIAVFSNINEINDSLLMVNLATGLSTALEKELSLPEGGISVYNLHSDSSTVWDNEYIQSLYQKSSSDVLMVIDKIDIGKPEQANLMQTQSEGKYLSLFVYVPYTSKMDVYDGLSTTKIASVIQTDTVYWEILSRNELRAANFLPKIYQSLIKVSENVGFNLADNFFGTWSNVQRYLYCFSNSLSLTAFQLAKDFKWPAAIEIWMEDIDSPDKLKSACAAFNLAVACEMTGKTDLAINWLNYSERCYPLQGNENYKSILKRQLETKGDPQTKP